MSLLTSLSESLIHAISMSSIRSNTVPSRRQWRQMATLSMHRALGGDYPLERCSTRVIAAIRRRDDVEDKLVVALLGEWSKASIEASTAFQERCLDSWVELPD